MGIVLCYNDWIWILSIFLMIQPAYNYIQNLKLLFSSIDDKNNISILLLSNGHSIC